MPIYTSRGRTYNIPEERINDFLSKRNDATLISDVPFYLSKANSPIDVSSVPATQSKEERRGQLMSQIDEKLNGLNPKPRQHAVWNENTKPLTNEDLQGFNSNSGTDAEYYERTMQLPESTQTPLRQRAATQESLEKSKEVLQESSNKGKTNFFSGAFRGIRDAVTSSSNWDFGASEDANNKEIFNAVQKKERGEQLTLNEQSLLDSEAIRSVVNTEFSDDLGAGYKSGKVTGESLPFMAEFAISPFSGSGRTAARWAGRKLLGNPTVLNKILRYGVRVAGDIVGAGAMAATTGTSNVSADATRRMTGQILPSIDKNGYISYGGTSGGEDFGTALAKSYGSTTIDNLSEMFGAYFSPILNIAGKAIGKGFEKIGLSKVNKLIGDVKASDWAKAVNDFERRTEWNGLLGEYGEEVAGGIMNSLVVGDQTLDTNPDTGVFNLNNNIDTFLGVSLMGGFLSGVKSIGYRTTKYQAQKQLRNSDKNGAKILGDNWEVIKSNLDEADEIQTISMLSGVLTSDEWTQDQKRAILSYSSALKSYQGVNLADVRRKSDGDVSPEQIATENAFDQGYKLSNPEDKLAAKQSLDEKTFILEKLVGPENMSGITSSLETSPSSTLFQMGESGYSNEAISAASDYAIAKAQYDGMLQNISDSVEEKQQDAQEIISQNINPQTQTVMTGMIAGNEEPLQIIGGNIVQLEDGSIDTEQSDKEIYYIDKEGNKQVTSIEFLNGISENIPAEEAIRMATEKLSSPIIAQHENDMIRPYEIGEIVRMQNGFLGKIVAPNENGTYSVAVESPSGIQEMVIEPREIVNEDNIRGVDNGSVVDYIDENGVQKSGEVQDAYGLRAQGMMDIDGDVVPISNIVGLANTTNVPKNEEQGKKISGEIISEEEKQNNLNKIKPEETTSVPTDEKGNELWHQLPPEQAFEFLNDGQLSPEEVNAFIDANEKESVSSAEKLSNKPPKVGTNRIKYLQQKKEHEQKVKEANKIADFWRTLKDENDSRRTAQEQSRKIQEEIKNEPRDTEELAAQMLADGGIRLMWSDEGQYKGLKSETGWSEGERNNMLGITATRNNGGMSVQEAGERVMEAAREMGYSFVDQDDANAGRNAILELLRGSRTWGNVKNYIAERRTEQDSREKYAEEEYQRQMYEEYIQNAYHMTPEEYELYEESFIQRIEEDTRDLDKNELNAIFAEAYQQQEYERRNEESTGRSNESSNPGEAENIQRESTSSQESGSTEQSEVSGSDGTIEAERKESTITGTNDGTDVVGDEHFRSLATELTRLEELTGRTNAKLFTDEDSLFNQAIADGIPEEDLYQEYLKSQRAKKEGKNLYGFHDGPTDNIYLFASGFRNNDELNAYWAHEQTHSVISSILSKEDLEKIYESAGERIIQEAIDPIYFEGNLSKSYIAEEYLAHKIQEIAIDKEDLADVLNGDYYVIDRITYDNLVKDALKKLVYGIYFDGRTKSNLRQVEKNEQGGSDRILQDSGISKLTGKGQKLDSEKNNDTETQYNSGNISRQQNDHPNEQAGRSGEGQIKLEELKEQEAQVNPDPSEAQKEAGNYKKGHIKLGSYDVTIETPSGTERSGVDPNGKAWSVTMQNTYGYFRGTEGKDGDHIDVFLGPDLESPLVYVVDQINEDGSFDEHKVMWGFPDLEAARSAYLSNYSPEWKGLGNITGVPREVFDEWMSVKTKKQKPFAEYKIASENQNNLTEVTEDIKYSPQEGESITFRHTGKLPTEEGEFCYVERVFRESGSFAFTGKNKIETADDVAYIFIELENSSVENAFVVLVNEGKPTIIHLGMGTFNQTTANLAAIKAAYDSIGADKIYFIHNHPSGTLKCSRQDIGILKTVSEMFGNGIVENGIIINTTSGEFGTFDLDGLQETNKRPEKQEEFPLKLFSFDKSVFSPDYNIQNHKIIQSSSDVAAIISSQRLGNRKKVSYLILDRSNKVIGNLHTTYDTIKENEKSLANEMASNVIRFGGMRTIIYGDFDIQNINLTSLNREIKRISGGTVDLLDCVNVDGLNTKSAADEGLMEAEANYKSVNDIASSTEDIRYRANNSEEAIQINKQFNEELQQQIDGTLPKGHVYQLGKPSEELRSSGIPNLPIELAASRLSDKSMQENHPFDLKEIKDFPQSIQNPIAVFRSATHIGSYVVMTEIEHKGKNFVVAIQTNNKRGKIEVNSIRSIHYRTSNNHMTNWIDEGLLEYVDKKRMSEWLSKQRYNSADVRKLYGRATNIIQSFENPTLEQGKIISEVEDLTEKLHSPIKIIRNTDEITDGDSSIKRESKGWYDPKTGEITLVLPNATSVEDAVATVLHEIVAHKGLREMLGGKEFDSLCDKVYNFIPEEKRSKIAKDYSLNLEKESDQRFVSDEYMASIAEKGVDDPGLWKKIKAWFKEALRKIGIDTHISDNDIAYLLWKSKNRLMEGDSEIQAEEKAIADTRVRNRLDNTTYNSVSDIASANGSSMSEEKRKELDARLKNLRFKFREAWEDRHLAVKEFLDLLRKNGTVVDEYNDYYKKATHISGKNDAQLEHYQNAYQSPLNKAIADLENKGFQLRDIENYAILKHGPERNEWMRQDAINKYIAKHPDATVEDIDQFTKKLPDDYSGVTEVVNEVNMSADDFINNFENKVGKDLVDNFWKCVKAATNFSLKTQLEGGLINKKLYDELSSRYKYYIPLRGHDAETAEDRWDYSPDTGTYFVNPIIKAKGRRSRSEAPFAFIAQAAQSAINSSNKNALNQTILRLSRKDKTGLLVANKTWYVQSGFDDEGNTQYEVQEAPYSEDPDTYRKNIEDFEERMNQLAKDGHAFQGGGKFDIGKTFIKPKQREQHAIIVFQNGVQYTVYVNANPAVSRAINGQNIIKNELKFISRATRWMAANFTTRNPAFIVTNFARDYLFSSSILPVKESGKYTLQFKKNIPKSAGALQRYLRGKGDLTKDQDRYLVEYIMNGAKTGFSHIIELQKVQKQIEREIKKGDHKNIFQHLVDAIGSCNEFAENLSRFSVYITSREQGRSIDQSVSDAKEVTVNFNRSGAGGYGAQYIRPLYLFVNAGIQALSNFAKVAQKNKKKTAVLLSSYMLSGFITPLLTQLLGGDDGLDEYEKLSDWERQNNLCIYTGSGFIKIPLPQELRVFHKMGDNIYQAIFGKKDTTEAFIETILGFADLIPANPAGSIEMGSWSNMMPDFVKPGFQLAENMDFAGNRITNEWVNENKPGYLRIRTNKKGEPYAPAFLVKLAELSDKATGGDGVEKGVISPNPDEINHIAKGSFGGLYTMAMQVIQIAEKAYDFKNTGELKVKARETPILKSFYTSSSDLQTINRGLNSKYFKVADEVKETIRNVKGYEKQVSDGELSIDRFYDKIKEMNTPKVYDLYDLIKDIKYYESTLKEVDGEEQKEFERIISDLKREALEINESMEK